MGEVDIKEKNILYLKQGVKSIKGKSKENLLLFTYYGGKFEMAKGPKNLVPYTINSDLERISGWEWRT